MDYWGGGGGGGAKGMLAPPSQIIGGPGPPLPFAYGLHTAPPPVLRKQLNPDNFNQGFG